MMSFYLFASLLLVSVIIVQAGEKVCPGYGFILIPQQCQSNCSIENDRCPMGKKCCFQVDEPCGYHCITPKDNESKNGKCPIFSSTINDSNWFLCDGHFCDVDNDCQGVKKCCMNLCGSPICVSPQ